MINGQNNETNKKKDFVNVQFLSRPIVRKEKVTLPWVK